MGNHTAVMRNVSGYGITASDNNSRENSSAAGRRALASDRVERSIGGTDVGVSHIVATSGATFPEARA